MAFAISEPTKKWYPSEKRPPTIVVNEIKDEAHSPSEDSTSSEEVNIAKIARFEETESPIEASHHQITKPRTIESQTSWNSSDSDKLYNISGWSEGYFKINSDGKLVMQLNEYTPGLVLDDAVEWLQTHKCLHTPMILRFIDILSDRITKLNHAFSSAITAYDYQNIYQGVFPVKCNHDANVVHSMVHFGRPYSFGLEVGSKAELVLAMSVMAENYNFTETLSTQTDERHPPPLLVCNGYKDLEYIELAMHCASIIAGLLNVVIVIEQPQELEAFLKGATGLYREGDSKTLKTLPFLGIRAKLSTAHGGHWGTTSGNKSKFGLNAAQILTAVNKLDAVGLLHHLALLHFHVGSQISTLSSVQDALAEGTALYAELHASGAIGLRYLDIGGGLAIDYSGSCSDSPTSRQYSIDTYALAVVGSVHETCTKRNVPSPTLVSESGRALVSHHSVVIFDVLDHHRETQSERGEEECASESSENSTLTRITTSADSLTAREGAKYDENINNNDNAGIITSLGLRSPLEQTSLAVSGPPPNANNNNNNDMNKAAFLLSRVQNLLNQLIDGNITSSPSALKQVMNDAVYYRHGVLRAFKSGHVGLQERSRIEHIVDAILAKAKLSIDQPFDRAVGNSMQSPVQTVHINLSVFRSAIDCWAISQVFPIVPLAFLNQQPTIRAILADLTCDSDGKIDSFPNPSGGDPLKSLPLHSSSSVSLNGPSPYRLAMFLAGAYQETMGGPHNLFGTLDTVTIRLCSAATMHHIPTSIGTTKNSQSTNLMYCIEGICPGENAACLLSRMGYDPDRVMETISSLSEKAVSCGRLSVTQTADINDAFMQRLKGTSYMK